MHVFIIQRRAEPAAAKFLFDGIERFQHALGFSVVQQPCTLQFAGVCSGASQVVWGELEVALRAAREGCQGVRGTTLKASTPKAISRMGHYYCSSIFEI
ncbi:hypothetical protein D3C79_518350 [compost metagenome]